MVNQNRSARRAAYRAGFGPSITPNSGAQAVVQSMVQHASVLHTKTIYVYDELEDGTCTPRVDEKTGEQMTFDIQYAPLSFFDRLRIRSEARVGYVNSETGAQEMQFREDVYAKAAIAQMVRVTPIEFSELVFANTADWLGAQLMEIVPQPEGDFVVVEQAKKPLPTSDSAEPGT